MVTMSSDATVAVLFFGGIYLTPLLHVVLHAGEEAIFIGVGLVVGLLVQLRDGGLLGRIGGEEFLVMLPTTDMAAARPLAERLRQTLAAASIADGTNTINLPASFGIAELQAAESQAEWFRRVDGALYQAKQKGRNAVVAAE